MYLSEWVFETAELMDLRLIADRLLSKLLSKPPDSPPLLSELNKGAAGLLLIDLSPDEVVLILKE